MNKKNLNAHILALYIAKNMQNDNNKHVLRFNKYIKIMHDLLFNYKFSASVLKKSLILNCILFVIWLLFNRNKESSLILLGLISFISTLMIIYIALCGLATRMLLAYISYSSKKQLDKDSTNNINNISNKTLVNSYVLYNRSHIYVFNCQKNKFFWQNPYKLTSVINYTNDAMREILKTVKRDHIRFINNCVYVCVSYPTPYWEKMIIDYSSKTNRSKQIAKYNSSFIRNIIYLPVSLFAITYMISAIVATIFIDHTLVLTFMYAQSIELALYFIIKLCIFLTKKMRRKLVKKAKANNVFFVTNYIIETFNYYLQPIKWKLNSKSEYLTYAIYTYNKTPENLARLHPKEIKQSIVYDYTNILPIHHF